MALSSSDVALLERKLEEQIQHNELVVRENDLFELYLKHNQAVRRSARDGGASRGTAH